MVRCQIKQDSIPFSSPDAAFYAIAGDEPQLPKGLRMVKSSRSTRRAASRSRAHDVETHEQARSSRSTSPACQGDRGVWTVVRRGVYCSRMSEIRSAGRREKSLQDSVVVTARWKEDAIPAKAIRWLVADDVPLGPVGWPDDDLWACGL